MVPSVPFNALLIIRRRKSITQVKKAHTIKNNIISNPDLRILYLSETYEGSVHDKTICDEEFTAFPWGIKLHQDTGFQGHLPLGVAVIQPLKKPKGKELTESQKQENFCISHQYGR